MLPEEERRINDWYRMSDLVQTAKIAFLFGFLLGAGIISLIWVLVKAGVL